MLPWRDPDVQSANNAAAAALAALVAGIFLISGAHVESAGGVLRGAAGLALVVATVLVFRKYWRGDWDPPP